MFLCSCFLQLFAASSLLCCEQYFELAFFVCHLCFSLTPDMHFCFCCSNKNLLESPIQIGNGRADLRALALGEACVCERLTQLLTGHVAALHHIVQEWSVVTGVERGKILRRWAGGLFPIDNQPYGEPGQILKSFRSVGAKFNDRSNQWRLHRSAGVPFTKWQKAAAKRSSAAAQTPTTKRHKKM